MIIKRECNELSKAELSKPIRSYAEVARTENSICRICKKLIKNHSINRDDDEEIFGAAYSHGAGMERIRKDGLITVETTYDWTYQPNGSIIYDITHLLNTHNDLYNYVINADNKILISKEKHFYMLGEPPGYNSDRGRCCSNAGEPFQIGPVKCAGEIMLVNNKIYVNNKSGTYRPRCENLNFAINLLINIFHDYIIDYENVSVAN
jgi:hypothetical protein